MPCNEFRRSMLLVEPRMDRYSREKKKACEWECKQVTLLVSKYRRSYRQLTLTHLLPMLRGGGDSPTLSAQVPSIQQGTLPAARTGGSPPNQASTVQSKVNQAPPRIYPSDGAPTHHIRDPPSPCSPGCGHPPYPQAKHSTRENKLGRRSGWERVACRVNRSTR